jgi:hypothetical protein
MGKTEAQTMLEIETAITALGPEAQRRVIDWIRARWVTPAAATRATEDFQVRSMGDTYATAPSEPAPQFAIRGTPLTSPWPHEPAAKAETFRQGVLDGGLGGEDVEQLISASDEAESLSAVFEAGPNEQTTALFLKLATDEAYRHRMRPFPQSPTPWWLSTAGVLSRLSKPELDAAIGNLQTKEGFEVAKRCLPPFPPGDWIVEEQWLRAKAIVGGEYRPNAQGSLRRRTPTSGRLDADEGIFPAAGEDGGISPGHALDLAEIVAGAEAAFDAFEDVVTGSLVIDDDAEAMLKESDWAQGLLADLQSTDDRTCAVTLEELHKPETLERLLRAKVSRAAIVEAAAFGPKWKHHHVMTWLHENSGHLVTRGSLLAKMVPHFGRNKLVDIVALDLELYANLYQRLFPDDRGTRAYYESAGFKEGHLAWLKAMWTDLKILLSTPERIGYPVDSTWKPRTGD